MTKAPANSNRSLSDDQLLQIVGPLVAPSPVVYWTDYLGNWFVGSLSLWGAAQALSPWTKAILLVICVLCFYRTVGFIHEIVHQKNQKFMKVFAPVWNVLTGAFFFLQSSYYLCHLQHHNRQHYGTSSDPQYPNFRSNKPHPLLFILIQTLITPLFFVLRCLLVTPMSLLVPKGRNFVLSRLSAFAEPGYIATYGEKERREILKYDLLHFFIWCGLIFALSNNWISLQVLYLWLVVFISVYFLNGFRILGEHRYDHGGEAKNLSKDDEFFDSYNYTSVFSELLYTTGLRYHALHHYVPSIPYHNLPKAHRLIMGRISSGSSYSSANSHSHMLNVIKMIRRG